MKNNNCIVVLGPTASGKTKLACQLAFHLNGEIISADSRQVYKHLNVGTGKDLEEYTIAGQKINYHLIDVCEPGEQFFLHQYIDLQEKAFDEIRSKNKIPIICGGTGLYLDILHKDFSFTQIKEDFDLRKQLEHLSKDELQDRLQKFPAKHIQHVDLNSTKRLIRAIEIAGFLQGNPDYLRKKENAYQPYYIGVNVDTEERKKLISDRLKLRLSKGLIEEVEHLIKSGISHERLQFLGLEYKFVSLHLSGQLSKEELFEKLQTAIFQFAKRQMTWFRKMEKEGVEINWVKRSDDPKLLLSALKEIIH